MTDEPLWSCFCVLGAAWLQLQANEDLAEAERIKARNPPWERFLRRRAAKKEQRASLMAPNIYGNVLPPLEDTP